MQLIPEITEQDIEWVCTLMGLDTPDAPRRCFLTARNTLDVSACPGSGKTTLVVAKLAILARKWPHKTKGICVLSHTNVAREQIERRLGKMIVGQRLLGYPHFIDTIHGFVNRFLALPWLDSNCYPPPTIDNTVTTAYRRRVLGGDYWVVQRALERRHSDFDRLRICARDLSFDLGGKPFPGRPGQASFDLAKRAIEAGARAGYFCYDEMFVWARALLEDCPAVTAWLRCRFPLVLLDEMQDTFELQSSILEVAFPRTASDITVQRLGDPNQAIFDGFDSRPNTSAPFPDSGPERLLEIPNSYRFGQGIAALASPFAITPVGCAGLCGLGPRLYDARSTACEHAIFVFPDDSTDGVLDCYGKHLLTTFDDLALACGLVTAVGSVHRDATDVAPGHAHFPKTVAHYWGGYDAEMTRGEPHPRLLIQYVRAAQSLVRERRDLAPGVEKLASGLVRLARSVGEDSGIGHRQRIHRSIVAALQTQPSARAAYRRLLLSLLIDAVPLTEEQWSTVRAEATEVVSALCDGEADGLSATRFLDWSAEVPVSSANEPASRVDPNVYRFSRDGRSVDIRLGSVHSVKGQTHLATMLLHTYWHDPSSLRILPWLLGARTNGDNAGSRDTKRLLQTYVAMTRPSHMICLAVPRSTFASDGEFAESAEILRSRGWRVGKVAAGGSEWIT